MAHVKHLCIFLLIQTILQFAYGKSPLKFFRTDYDYLEETESFYKIHTLRKSWESAKRRCALEGAHLFYPLDQTEADAVLKYLNETQPSFHYVFVGISSKLAKGVFQTVDGLSLRDVYNRWAPGEPNDSNGIEDCLVLSKESTYNDDNCSKKMPFICKKTLTSINWNDDCNAPDKDYKYNENLGRCYKFHLSPMSWRDALETCDAEQSYMAIINSSEEADHLVNITAQAPKDKVNGWYLRGAVHLGFSYDTTDDTWRTTSGLTLENAGYEVWGYYQPDGGEHERCGSMFYNGYLNDISCENQKCFFICERENPFHGILEERFGS